MITPPIIIALFKLIPLIRDCTKDPEIRSNIGKNGKKAKVLSQVYPNSATCKKCCESHLERPPNRNWTWASRVVISKRTSQYLVYWNQLAFLFNPPERVRWKVGDYPIEEPLKEDQYNSTLKQLSNNKVIHVCCNQISVIDFIYSELRLKRSLQYLGGVKSLLPSPCCSLSIFPVVRLSFPIHDHLG